MESLVNVDQKLSFAEIFDADLVELNLLRGRTFVSTLQRLYLRALVAYLSSDNLSLEQASRESEDLIGTEPDAFIMNLALQLRLQIRKHTISTKLVDQLKIAFLDHPPWQGEVAFIIAYASDCIGNDVDCRDWNRRAFSELHQLGARRKAVRALANAVAAESRIQPDRHCIPDLLQLLRLAQKANDVTTTSMTMIHLSREYSKLSAKNAALRFAQRAVAVASQNPGNLTYYYSLCQRAHLLAQSGLWVEARMDIELAAISPFNEILNIVETLKCEFPLLSEDGGFERKIEITSLPMFWRDPSERQSQSGTLGPLETQLLKLLSQRPRSKSELIKELYGDLIAVESAGNRLNNLLNRIRSKRKGLITLFDGHYRLVEDSLLKVWKV